MERRKRNRRKPSAILFRARLRALSVPVQGRKGPRTVDRFGRGARRAVIGIGCTGVQTGIGSGACSGLFQYRQSISAKFGLRVKKNWLRGLVTKRRFGHKIGF